MEIDAKIWDKIVKLCKNEIKETDFNMFFKNIEIGDFSDNVLTLNCTSQLMKTNVQQYKYLIEEKLEILVDESIEVVFEVVAPTPVPMEIYKLAENKKQVKTGLNLKYTFDNFVIGSNSKLAFEACYAVSRSIIEENRAIYNPVLIYGSSGLGKTHLMQAVGNEILEKRPDKNVYYVTSEEFSNEYYKLLRSRNIEEFREIYRNLDVLLLDDIQFFENVFGKGEGLIQEEFFHTFNTLKEEGKQIIMISDRYPDEIKNFAERLKTRMLQGATFEMERPGYETRMEILKNFIKDKGVQIDKNILEYIADTVSSNVRELEGILVSVIARAKLLNLDVTLQIVQEELSKKIRNQQSKITSEKIIEIVSKEYNISVSDMKSKKRMADITNARQIAMYLLKVRLDLSLTAIGGLLGGRDHSTVISSIRKIEEKIEKEISFKKDIDRLKENIDR